ncbi:FAD-dependent monooxygenase [Brasilonema sp. CT11]|nr:FAD-dependent monooxygenase [Brasilonema sp. CT11]
MHIYDVLVVGAGPIGLATALGLRQRGIENILVIDQTRAFRQVGQVIDLLPNGLNALKYIDLKAYEEVKKKGMSFLSSTPSNDNANQTTQKPKSPKTSPEWVQKNFKGERIRATPLSYDHWFQQYGEGRVSIAWYDLQTILRNLLPEDSVKANHRCINVVYEPEYKCVRVDCVSHLGGEQNPYAHWENAQNHENAQPENLEIISQQSETKSFRAKLVVAADGINSTVRRILYKNTPYQAFARPEYSGFAAVGCQGISEVSNKLLTELNEKFFENSRIVTIFNDEISRDSDCMKQVWMMLFQRKGGQLGYIIHLALPLDSLKHKSGTALIDLALLSLEKANFPTCLKQLVSLSPPANMLQRPYYIHRAMISDRLQFPSTANLNLDTHPLEMQPAWKAQRVVLVGDAAHGMPPFMAQGANQGFEDALAIATLIANIKDKHDWDNTQAISEAFDKYEHLRRPFMVDIQKATLERLYWSDKEWQDYSQKLYRRNFNKLLETLQ